MRFTFILAALALSACATAPPAAAPGPAPVATAPSTELEQLLRAAGGANAPTQRAIERAFGPPDLIRHDGAGAAATYRLETCALLLLFTPDARGEMRLVEAHPGARRAAEAAPSLEQCAAEVSARGRGA